MLDFFIAYFLTIFIEGAVLLLLLRGKYGNALIILNAVIASSLTLPFVWFFFPVLGFGSWVLQTTVAESFAFLAEAGIYKKLFAGMQWKDAIIASFICNACSFLTGFIFF